LNQPIEIAEYQVNKAIMKEIKTEINTIEAIELATTRAIRKLTDSRRYLD